MMSALRMVWIISRHYNRDERMVPLMERIANQLCDRVARSINVRTLFRHLDLNFSFEKFRSLFLVINRVKLLKNVQQLKIC
jgi:hypothetical protein